LQAADGWNATIEFYTGYSMETITPCVEAMRALLKSSIDSQYQAVQKKWNHTRYFHLSQSAELFAYVATLSE
jgi:hypothetical protein